MSSDHSPLSFVLPPHEVHVWYANTDVDASVVAQCMRGLSKDEALAVGRYHFERDRRSHAVSRAALRSILGQYLSVAPEQLQFLRTSYGKPYVLSAQDGLDLRFNLSHSGNLVACALTCGRDVGIDMEEIRDLDDCPEIARDSFTSREWNSVAELEGEDRRRAFFTLWTRKEAYIKARGLGLSIPLKTFEVAGPSGEARVLDQTMDRQLQNEWTVTDLDVPSGYAGAVVVAGQSCKVIARQWWPSAPNLRQ